MEEFDFNAPIDATVIFDDSDEETNASTEKIQSTSENRPSVNVNDVITQEGQINSMISKLPETVDRIQSLEGTKNIHCLETTNNFCYAVSEINITNAAKSKEKPLDMPSLEEETTMALPGNTVIMPHSNNNQTKKQNNTRCLKQQTRKLSTNEKKPKRKLTTEKKATENYYKSAKNLKPSVIVTENNQPTSQFYYQPHVTTEIPLSYPQTQNKETEQQYTVNIEVSPTSTKYFNQEQLNPEVDLSLPLSEPSVSNYLKELLNTVSEHMIYIVNSYQSYVRIYKHCRDQSLIEHAKNNYIRTKRHFFDLSYSSVLNIIIPKEDDVTFVKSFLDNTVNIAVSKSYNYTYIHVEPLFIEMIDWVKKRRDFIQKMDLNKIPNPLLIQQLLKPPLNTLPSTLPPPAYPELEEQIHKPNTAMNRNNILTTSVPSSQNVYTESLYNYQNDSPRIQPQNREDYGNQAFCTQPTTYHFCQNRNHQSVIVRNEQQQQNYYDAQKMVPCEKQTTPLWEKEGTQRWQMQAWQKQVTQETGQKQGTPQSWQKQAAQQSWQKPAAQQSWQKQAVQQSCQRQPARPCQSPGNLPSIQSFQRFQQADLTVNNQYVVQENQVEMNIRSSISRDSGFISPLNFSTSDQSSHQEEQRSQVTPFITHVTSLNPNASYITEGACTVCGKSTKKKCLGCYKCYYCSHNCQYSDWKNHMAVCK